MQDNQLHLNLTVDEAMNVAAKLKIGDKPKHEREDIVRNLQYNNVEQNIDN